MQALVLSGGAVKGAFQAGALRVLLERGFVPDYIWGVSVGALNGALLADRAGRAAPEAPDWAAIGAQMEEFWRKRIRTPADIVRQRTRTAVAWGTLRGRFKGLLDNAPLRELLRETLSVEALRRSPVRFHAGVVNLADGQFFNADTRYPDLVEYILASATIPIAMPLVELDGAPLADGGVREIAPLRHALHAGAERVVVVACQARRLSATALRSRNLFSLIDRVADILTDEILQRDLETAAEVNLHVPADGAPATTGPYPGKRRVEIQVIRPVRNPRVDLMSFRASDIHELLELGKAAAHTALG